MNPSASSLLSRLLLDRAHGHRRHVLESFSQALRADTLDPEERRAAQDRRLAELLEYAATRVPFYRGRISSHPVASARARDVLRGLPIVTRADIQADPRAFFAEDVEHFREDATGGSTGTPMRFRVDRATQQAREASLYWSDSLAGWRYGERIAMLWGSDKDVKTASQLARAEFRWWIDNRRWYNAFNMGEAEMARFHKGMQRFRPHIVVAYAGSMEVYARYLEAHGLRPDYPLRAIICSAEVLTPKARETIERVFGKPVFNRYGNREFGAIAAECEAHEGLHLNERDMIVEIDSPDPEKEPGRLIVTYLHNRAMPFLRYDTGDLARLIPARACPCGRHTLRLAAIVGRASDTIRTAAGKLIHGEFFTHLLYDARRVRAFQFVQESVHDYRLLLVSDAPEPADVERRWRANILEEVGADSRLTIEYVDHIPVLASGKRKFTLSKIT